MRTGSAVDELIRLTLEKRADSDAIELAGLGALAAPAAAHFVKKPSKGLLGKSVKYLKSPGGVAAAELAGLGILAAPHVLNTVKPKKTEV
jgi:hypothetical protein